MGKARKLKRAANVLPEAPPEVAGIEWGHMTRQEDLRFYLPGAIPAGALIVVEGRKATGKSTVAAALAACVTGGTDVPGWTGPRDRRVIWFGSEDPWSSVVVPRLVAAGASLDRVCRARITYACGHPRLPLLPAELEWLRGVMTKTRPGLVVLDPFVSLCGSGIDLRVEQQARSYLDPLAQLAGDHDCVFVLVRHLRKGDLCDAREAGLGSVGIGNAARSVLRTDEHPHAKGQKTLAVVAGNYGVRMPTQIFALADAGNGHPRVDWLGSCDLDAEDIAEGRGSAAERDEWNDADRLLALMIGEEWVAVTTLMQDAEKAGVSWRIVRRAKERLRVPSERRGYGLTGDWFWGKPPGGWPAGLIPSGNGGGACARGGAPLENLNEPTPQKPLTAPKAPKAPPSARVPPPKGGRKGGDNGEV
jgi:hypothetical protein